MRRAGNRSTGAVAWDRDIRPSDATYLAEQCGAPIYVDSSIWHNTSMTHSEFLASEVAAADAAAAAAETGAAAEGEASPAPEVSGGGAALGDVSAAGGGSVYRSARRAGGAGAAGDETAVSEACARAGVLCASPPPAAHMQLSRMTTCETTH